MTDPILDSQYPADNAERQREADAKKLGVPASMLAPAGGSHPANPADQRDPRSADPGYVLPPGASNLTDPVAREAQRAHAAQAEQDRLAANPPGFGVNAPVVDPRTPAGSTAFAKLRAFEDQYFGRDVPRINGEIERGVGSRYAAMTPHQKAHHASLEHLVRSERAMGDASADLELSKARHETAVRNSDIAAKAIVTADAAAKTEADRVAADRKNYPPGSDAERALAAQTPGQVPLQTRQNLPGEVNWNTATDTPSVPGHTGQAATPATPWTNNQPGQPNNPNNPNNNNPTNRPY